MNPVHFRARPIDREADWPTWLTPEEREYGQDGLYRFYDARRQLLYVGISQQMMVRWSAHRNRAKWWAQVAYVAVSFFPGDCPISSATAERASIAHEKPPHNKNHTCPSPAVELSLRPHVPPSGF
ncbi:GIY-YIG nuclease family protein [Streptomyces lydicus]|uniref:GIY-YIG nuclease family protein n=1 Tax=Streptomyces lydicus TaxID=47763 RepID=UPI0036E51562